MIKICAFFLHRPLALSRCLLSHRFHTNSHKPWRAPPRTLLTTLWLQPSRPSTTKNSVQAVSEGGVRGKNSPRTFPRVEIPRMSFPTGRVCASLRGGVLSLDPSVLLLGNSVFAITAMFTVTQSRLVCALRLFASLPWF